MRGQLDLFAPRPRNFDEAALVRRLRALRTPDQLDNSFSGANAPMTDRQIRRLMTPLPRVTAFD